MYSEHFIIPSGFDLIDGIKVIAKNYNNRGFISSSVGNLSKAVFKCPTKTKPVIHSGELELITLNGFFSNSNIHLHLSFSDSSSKVYAGHLLQGTIVFNEVNLLVSFIETNPITLPSLKVGNKIVIYTVYNCMWTSKILAKLNRSNKKYKTVIIDNETDLIELMKLTNTDIFPQIFIDDKFIGGYTEFTQFESTGFLRE